MTQTGGCLCGNIRYTLKADPTMTVVCHCTHCQKNSGSAFSTNLIAQRADLEFSGGEPAVFVDRGESGNDLKRSFCPKCGSPIMSEPGGRPGVAILKAGTLDDVSRVNPSQQIWTRSAQSWVKFATDIPAMEKGR